MQIQTANYDLVTTWQGGMASRTRCRSITGDRSQSHVIDSDEPVALGGEGRAPAPQDLMLAAFNACMTAAFVQEARGADLTLTHLDIETRGELLTEITQLCDKTTELSPGRLQYVIHVSGNGTAHQFECVHQRVINASLNRWLLAQNMTIEGDLILI
ncbi:OsmC family protein [Leclercia pneumoniae]|uniref:OsmC family protein n=1 Tax=Leclercia pneumoniae TaxID=2815358 RepID=A0ABX8JT72_9ENTR|nr:OsmC family protein [Leclercia pneumoniae]MCV2510943.1 OsmC family protein [Leclercia pneumoniae]QSW36483.1 OsmC family protein [Leclercia pneumoniae]QWW78599.1 OsmC family protein [Leclercia pneumoniae]WNN82286.1 OsmC family protein [Leclercia pneumoniae]